MHFLVFNRIIDKRANRLAIRWDEMVRLPSVFPYRRRTWEDALRSPFDFRHARNAIDRRWIPDTHIRMEQALDLLGRDRIENWNGKEKTSRAFNAPPDPPWNWQQGEHLHLDEFFVFGEDGEPKSSSEKEALSWWSEVEPILNREWEEEAAARQRWLECRNMMRNELACERFEALVLRKGGDFFKIPVERWLGEMGGEPIRTGVAKFLHSHGYSTFEIEGPVLLERLFLQKEKTEVSKSEAQVAPTINEVRFPYLAFMIVAAREAPFSSKGRTSKKTLEGWIRDNWPDGLGEATETKITNMATFLRRPEDERGGIHRKGPGQ